VTKRRIVLPSMGPMVDPPAPRAQGPAPGPRIWRWDYNEQPPLEEIAAFIAELSGGKVVLQEVETGSQEYAWTVSGRSLSDQEREQMNTEAIGG
jgi:hypothetical protein